MKLHYLFHESSVQCEIDGVFYESDKLFYDIISEFKSLVGPFLD